MYKTKEKIVIHCKCVQAHVQLMQSEVQFVFQMMVRFKLSALNLEIKYEIDRKIFNSRKCERKNQGAHRMT